MDTASLLIDPGPAEMPGSNDRRTGAPNHHQNSHTTTGSGGTTMVGAIVTADHSPDEAAARFVRDRLAGQTHRFTLTAHLGSGGQVWLPGLVDVVTEIVTEFTDHVVAERDALAEDLAFELNARGGVQGGDR